MAKAHPSPVVRIENDVKAEAAIIPASPAPTMAELQKKLRQRWELASVLNFLHVFEPVIQSGLKVSAEQLEAALIEPNNTLGQLHTVLLKGIGPHSKSPKSPDSWIIHLSKTLAAWWPWVAEGDFPLAESKGKEISTYQEFGPADRLVILKALCEARADQPDVTAYVNDALKNGTEVSAFQSTKLADDGKGTMFWYDGNEITGHRLYKERFFEKKRVKRKDNVPAMSCQWETLATDLEEFNKIVEELSSSSVEMEVALSKSIEADIMPVLKKHWKKKQKALRLKERVLMPSAAYQNPGVTRSCRNRGPIDYRFDDFDKAITEAIQYTNKRKSSETTSVESHHSEINPEDNKDTATRNDQGSDFAASSSDEEYDDEKENIGSEGEDIDMEVNHQKQSVPAIRRSKGLRFSTRIAGVAGHILPESMNLGAKNRLRQMPSPNTAVKSEVPSPNTDVKSEVPSLKTAVQSEVVDLEE